MRRCPCEPGVPCGQLGGAILTQEQYDKCCGVGLTDAEHVAYLTDLFGGQKPAKEARRQPCQFLGEETGERRKCASCKGNVEQKVRVCSCPQRTSDPTTVILYCTTTCPFYEKSHG